VYVVLLDILSGYHHHNQGSNFREENEFILGKVTFSFSLKNFIPDKLHFSFSFSGEKSGFPSPSKSLSRIKFTSPSPSPGKRQVIFLPKNFYPG